MDYEAFTNLFTDLAAAKPFDRLHTHQRLVSSNHQPLLLPADPTSSEQSLITCLTLGRSLGRGKDSEVFEVNDGQMDMAMKVFWKEEKFEKEKAAYQHLAAHGHGDWRVSKCFGIYHVTKQMVPEMRPMLTEHDDPTESNLMAPEPYGTALVIELVQGTTLETLIHEVPGDQLLSKGLSLQVLKNIEKNVTETVGQLHSIGLTHSDVYSCNIILRKGRDGQINLRDAVLIDLGEAHLKIEQTPRDWERLCDGDRENIQILFEVPVEDVSFAMGVKLLARIKRLEVRMTRRSDHRKIQGKASSISLPTHLNRKSRRTTALVSSSDPINCSSTLAMVQDAPSLPIELQTMIAECWKAISASERQHLCNELRNRVLEIVNEPIAELFPGLVLDSDNEDLRLANLMDEYYF